MREARDDHPAGAVLRQMAEGAHEAMGISGLVLGQVREGATACAAAGFADRSRGVNMATSSRFNLGCITKLIVGAACLKMIKEGRLALDDHVAKWLPQFDADGCREIRVRHLLAHTSGFQGPFMLGVPLRSFTWDGFVSEFNDLAKIHSPGRIFNYENTGHVILGEILEKIANSSILEICDEFVFNPIGVTLGSPMEDYRGKDFYAAPHIRTGDEYRVAAPSIAGPFWRASLADRTISIPDLLRIGRFLIDDVGSPGGLGVGDAISKPLTTLPGLISGRVREHTPKAFNALCAEYDAGWFGYAGSAGGHTCALRFNPATNAVSAVGMNIWAPVWRDYLMSRLCGVSAASGPRIGGNPDLSSRALAGRYVGGGNIVRVVDVAVESGRLICSFPDMDHVLKPMIYDLDGDDQLVPDERSKSPAIGFFVEKESGARHVQVGMAALRAAS